MTCWPSRCKPKPKAYQHHPTSSCDECGSKYTNPPFGWWFTNAWWMWIQITIIQMDPFMEPSFGSQMAWPQLAKRLQRATKRPSACLSCIRPIRWCRWLGPVWAPKDSWASWVIQNLNILNLTYGLTYGWLIQKILVQPRAFRRPWFNESLPRGQTTTIQILFKLWFLDVSGFPVNLSYQSANPESTSKIRIPRSCRSCHALVLVLIEFSQNHP